MIHRRHKKSIAWLFILGMFHLVLISVSGGMLMASPLDDAMAVQMQSSNSDASACDMDIKLLIDQEKAACNQCSSDSCVINCSFCTPAYLGNPAGIPGSLTESEIFITPPPSGLLPFSSPPIPRPPTQLHS
jgi:hypothetical protein